MHNKPKHQNHWKEIGFGGIALLIASPLIAYSLIYSVMAFIAGFSYLSRGVEFAPSLITASGLGIVGLTFALWQVIQRFRYIVQRQRANHIRQQEATYDDISYAEHRLMDVTPIHSRSNYKETTSKKHFIQG